MMVNTVTGPVAVDALGKTLMHEHLVVGFPGWESDTTQIDLRRQDMIAHCV
jgi:phosphotriesterase-related protein